MIYAPQTQTTAITSLLSEPLLIGKGLSQSELKLLIAHNVHCTSRNLIAEVHFNSEDRKNLAQLGLWNTNYTYNQIEDGELVFTYEASEPDPSVGIMQHEIDIELLYYRFYDDLTYPSNLYLWNPVPLDYKHTNYVDLVIMEELVREDIRERNAEAYDNVVEI